MKSKYRLILVEMDGDELLSVVGEVGFDSARDELGAVVVEATEDLVRGIWETHGRDSSGSR